MKDHPSTNILENPGESMKTRSTYKHVFENNLLVLISHVEPKNVNEVLEDDSWIQALHEELHQFQWNKLWTLVPRPNDHSVIGTHWVFKNKLDENRVVVRNKALLVAKGYSQETKIDFDDSFGPVAHLRQFGFF